MRPCEGRCYAIKPATLVVLKTEIIRIFKETDVAMLQLIIHNFLTHLEKVTEMDSGHIENVLH